MKIVKYFFVGGIAATIDVGLFFIFAKFFKFNYLVVAFFTFIIATYVNYFLSIKFVFKSGEKYKKNKELLFIYLVSGSSLILNLLLLYFFYEIFLFDVVISKIIVIGLLFFYNYFVRRFFIFVNS